MWASIGMYVIATSARAGRRRRIGGAQTMNYKCRVRRAAIMLGCICEYIHSTARQDPSVAARRLGVTSRYIHRDATHIALPPRSWALNLSIIRVGVTLSGVSAPNSKSV